MKKIIPAILCICLMVCGCGNVTTIPIGDSNSDNKAVSADPVTISEDSISEDAVSENQLEEVYHERPVSLVISISENEAEYCKNFTFSRLPDCVQDLEELQEMGILYFNDPYFSAALEIVCLCEYTKNPDMGLAMLEYLNGPEDLTDFEKDLYERQLVGKEYKPFSYFAGATPENYYTPDEPYTLSITGDKFSEVLTNRATVYASSSGSEATINAAPNTKQNGCSAGRRAINVRYETSDDHWYVYETGLLGEIRKPGPEEVVEEEVEEENGDSVSDNSGASATTSANNSSNATTATTTSSATSSATDANANTSSSADANASVTTTDADASATASTDANATENSDAVVNE